MRCHRCNAVQKSETDDPWIIEPCERCGYPEEDQRTPEQIDEDDAAYEEFIQGIEGSEDWEAQ